MVTLALSLLLAAEPSALEPPPEVPDAPKVPIFRTPRARSFFVPAVEAFLINFGLASFNNLVSREPFAQVSVQSMLANLPLSRWSLDTDYFLTNQFGHPYQGAWSFTAARSSGLSFWWSTLYAFVASLTWELFFEVDPPSVNDQITTTLGGAFLGEALFRFANLLLNAELPRWARETFAALLSPPTALNRALFDGQLAAGDLPSVPFFRGWIGGGLFVQSSAPRLGGFLTARVIHGGADEEWTGPFSHFDVAADLSIDRTSVTGDFTVRGLLVGRGFRANRFHGLYGLFGSYEYVAPQLFRASSVNVGAGSLAHYDFSDETALELTAIGSAIPFGAGGLVRASDATGGRDYHVGPGVHLEGELSLANERFGFLNVGLRRWNLFGGLYTQPAGHDAITYVHANVFVRTGRHLLVGLELVRALRDSRFDSLEVNQALTQLRLTLSWLLTGELGIVSQ